MDNVIGFILSVISLIINFSSTIISFYILIVLIRRVYRLRDINIFLTMNSYISIFICHLFNICFDIQAILGDTKIFIISDSFVCRLVGQTFLFFGIILLDSFSIQSFIRMLSIIYPTRQHLRSLKSIIIFTGVIWFTAVLRIIPTVFLKSVAYHPSDYMCTLDLRVWLGNVYMTFAVYCLAIAIVIICYVRVILFSRKFSLQNQIVQRKRVIRDAIVLQRIVLLVNTLVILGLPSAVFWIIDMITGDLHYLTYRIQAICLSIGMFIITFAVALTNPKVKSSLSLFNFRHSTRIEPFQLQQFHQ